METQNLVLERYSNHSEYVPVIFARNMTMAEKTRRMLERCGIPTLIEWNVPRRSGLESRAVCVPVLVPESRQEEASERVARLERRFPVAGIEDEEESVGDEDLDDDFFDEEEFEDEDFTEDDEDDDDLFEDDDDL